MVYIYSITNDFNKTTTGHPAQELRPRNQPKAVDPPQYAGTFPFPLHYLYYNSPSGFDIQQRLRVDDMTIHAGDVRSLLGVFVL